MFGSAMVEGTEVESSLPDGDTKDQEIFETTLVTL